MDKKLILKEVKVFKGIPESDTVQDELLTLAISESIDRILAKMNEFADDEIKAIPERLTFIVRDVAVKRFNRLNSEGARSGFGTIRNNTALKPCLCSVQSHYSFGTIRNNTALKPE